MSWIRSSLIFMMALTAAGTASAQFGGAREVFERPFVPEDLTRPPVEAPTWENCKLGEEVFTTPVSGEVSEDQDVLHFPGHDYYGLKRIENWENRDEPCRTRATFGRLAGATALVEELSATSNTCEGTIGDKIEVGATQHAPEGVFIGSIQAWTSGHTNADRRRLKGLVAKPRTVTEDCEVSPGVPSGEHFDGLGDDDHDYGGTTITWVEEDKRNRARDLFSRRFCRAGQIATGLILHRGDRGVSGVQLECRDVVRR